MIRLTPAAFALLGSTFAASAALAAAQAAPSAPPAAVQVGDGALSCSALAERIGALSQPPKAEAASRGRRLFGFATAALQVAAPLAGGLGGGGNASDLIGAVAQQGAMSAMQHAADGADSASGAGADRRERLVALFDARGC